MEITFHNVLGSIVLILILLYIVRTLFRLNTEGFETILTTIPSGKDMTNLCPANQTLVYQLLTLASGTTPATFKYACYSEGITNVNSTFLNDNLYLYISTPKDYNVKLYTAIDASGNAGLTLSSENTLTNNVCGDANYCIGDTNKTPNMKFASIKVFKKTNAIVNNDSSGNTHHGRHRHHKRRKNALSKFYDSSTCPGLSPAARAAAAAADAKAVVDKKKATDLALIVSSALIKSGEASVASNNGLSITCPSGDDPVLNERNTKFSAKTKDTSMYDSSCGSNEYVFNPETES